MSSNETSFLERTTAPHDGLPTASHRPQREGMLSEVSFEEHFKFFLNAKICLELRKSCICLAVHLNEKLQWLVSIIASLLPTWSCLYYNKLSFLLAANYWWLRAWELVANRLPPEEGGGIWEKTRKFNAIVLTVFW